MLKERDIRCASFFQASTAGASAIKLRCQARRFESLTHPGRPTREGYTYLAVYGVEQRRFLLGELARVCEDVVRVVKPPRLLELPLTWQKTRTESGGRWMRQDALVLRPRRALGDLFGGYASHKLPLRIREN